MSRQMLASDRVLLLLSLVPYLREHGPTPTEELARTFDVDATLLRRLVGFLGTAGIPGETLAYQHDDLFDIDWDLFEHDDVVALTRTVAVEETPRFTGVETAALLAGLHALTPMLGQADAELARDLASRLGGVIGGGSTAAVSVAGGRPDERLTTLISAIEQGSTVGFEYRDAEGKRSERTVDPISLSEREGVWYLRGFNHERGAERTFRVDQCASIAIVAGVSGQPEPSASVQGEAPAAQRPVEWITAVVPNRLLPALRGFAPEVLAELENGEVRIRIEAWHPGAAVRLVQHGPGEIEIVAPADARQAVGAWVESALDAYSANGAAGASGE